MGLKIQKIEYYIGTYLHSLAHSVKVPVGCDLRKKLKVAETQGRFKVKKLIIFETLFILRLGEKKKITADHSAVSTTQFEDKDIDKIIECEWNVNFYFNLSWWNKEVSNSEIRRTLQCSVCASSNTGLWENTVKNLENKDEFYGWITSTATVRIIFKKLL